MRELATEVLADAEAAAKRGAAYIAEQARAAVAERGSFTLAVSGGHGPWAMFAELALEDMPWAEMAIYQVDERVAAAGDDDRNLTHLLASLPVDTGAAIHPMPVEDDDLEDAAEAYARLLPESLDLVHLGLGPDGHTASLFSGDPVLDISDRAVAVTGPHQGRRRITLTYPTIDGAQRILWYVTGDDKVDALRKLLAGDASIPASRVATAQALVVADAAATGSAP